ncbi:MULTISPECIES: ribosome biogenesis GTPase Der [unclassified Devosia]|uniref:ribosome biogenesis GTPase Der n=1 Tax=unclassified Devosia TaxID=196773 RepID=UPI00145D9E04|nr:MULTISPECIES: ribosome biogenesis GTPase Der [unclassified Devosia]MBJ6988823.1 ribosome biogenesis GTPase Der [Devosia sp. MC521]MBJ7578189.1 ribosome biogenesis GTPase Der [Devosia sp. MC532]MBK1794144.1 ribosome biogenesis GTPase Der [Devosia sp. WQ 349K1]QMW63637.1 ribosome biogenesis GTPase Der [Devosia sp. MC521]
MTVTVAIVGRPNVGKSTLFNRLVGRKIALVDDTPGVTRDRREAEGHIADLTFRVLDTAGYEDVRDGSLEDRMRQQTELAINEADVILFMIDARAGVVPLDERFAQVLRKAGKHVHLVGNKAEAKASEHGLVEAFKLGFGEPIALSAEHGLGLSELYSIVSAAIDKAAEKKAQEEADAAAGEQSDLDFLPEVDVDITPDMLEGEGDDATLRWNPKRYLNVAIVGRPNAGKSTLVNRMVGEERVLVGPEAGITRDSILVPWEWEGRTINLVDTAGIRRRSRVQEKLEKLAVGDSLRSLQYAEVVVLMLDATIPFEKQDLALADLVEREGRAMVIALNKWDLIEDKNKTLTELREECERLLPQVRGIPLVTLSGLTGKNIDRLMEAIFEVERSWNAHVSTSRLNRWLSGMIESHPPPAVAGRRLKMRYMTQAKTRPPSYIIFASRPEVVPMSYQRYLVNGLREAFGIKGSPIRIWLRGGKNPYAPKD